MYFITLNICACILLLSSVVTITVLLRKRFRQWRNTSLYVLSMSDVLFSVFTSTILFINCMERIARDTNSAAAKVNDSTIIECDITNAVIKYGTLFLPFTNSFVSLLMFSVQCNLNVFDLKDKCCKSLWSEEEVCDGQFERDSKGTREIPSIERNRKSNLRASELGKMKRGITAGFVLSQWIVPVTVTGLLYLANFDKNSTKEATKCFTESVFFFDDCINAEPTTVSQDSMINGTPVYANYIDEDLKLNKSNSTQVNEIIVKVQNLVFSLINDTSTVSFDRISYNSSEASNSTRYFELDTYTILLEQNKSNDNEFYSGNSAWAEMGENSNLIDADTNITSETYLSNYTSEGDSYYNDLTMNVSSYIVKEENYDNEITTDIVETLDTDESETGTMDTTVKYGVPIMSSDQIYAEILKRIHNVPAHHKYDKNKNYYNKKHPKELGDGKYSKHSSALNDYLLSNVNTSIYQQDNSSEVTLVHSTGNCFISVQFLKVHLLPLVFVIYFLPILFSSILQQRGKSICKIILERLEARNKVPSNRDSDLVYEINDADYELSTDSRGPGTSGPDLKCPSKDCGESIHFDKLQFVETREEDTDKTWGKHCKNSWQWKASLNENQQSIINQMENTSKLFDTIRKSSLCGTILWTPLFLEFLIKVFVSLHVPEWLLNVTYLTATMFGTLRNIFNLRMIKCQEANVGISKTNSIHPAT